MRRRSAPAGFAAGLRDRDPDRRVAVAAISRKGSYRDPRPPRRDEDPPERPFAPALRPPRADAPRADAPRADGPRVDAPRPPVVRAAWAGAA